MPTIKELFGRAVLGLPEDFEVPVFPDPDGRIPAPETYAWMPWSMQVLRSLLLVKRPLWIYGETGSGKSTAVYVSCARLRMPLWAFTGSARTEIVDLVGRWAVKGGTTEWVDGPLTRACRIGGVFMLDEADTVSPDVLVGLNGVLDGKVLAIQDSGESVPVHPEFQFVATANSVGDGLNAARYAGTMAMNAAFLDRFSIVKAEYMPAAVERQLLGVRWPHRRDVIAKLVRWANAVRSVSAGGQHGIQGMGATPPMCVPVSSRSLKSVLAWMDAGLTVEEALETCVWRVSDGNPAVKMALAEMWQRVNG